MKVALYQSLPTDGDIEKAFVTIESCLQASAHAGASMVVFPELYFPGYQQPESHRQLAQAIDGDWMSRIAKLTKKHNCGLTVGWAELCDGKVYNSASCFDNNGALLSHYRKIQLFNDMEKRNFTAGSAYQIFDLNGYKTAMLICYDIEFPEHCRALAQQGVKLILVPTANPKGYEHVSRVLVPARAYEMSLTIVYANYCGTEQGLVYAGLSLVAGPDSKPIAMAGNSAMLLIADLSEERNSALNFQSTQLTDYIEVK